MCCYHLQLITGGSLEKEHTAQNQYAVFSPAVAGGLQNNICIWYLWPFDSSIKDTHVLKLQLIFHTYIFI